MTLRLAAKIVFSLLCVLLAVNHGFIVGLSIWCVGGLALIKPQYTGEFCERLTMLDLVRPDPLIGGLVEENIIRAPELQVFEMAQLESGISYKTLHRIGLPTTGFRKINQGVDPSKSRYESREHKCFLFSGRVEYDRAAGQADSGGLAAIEARESSGVMLSSMQEIGSQIFNGVANEAEGFPGLKAFTPFGGAYTLNATGAAANTASSIYGVIMGEDYCRLIGGAGDIFNLGDFRDETLRDENDKPFAGRAADLLGWVGLQCSAKFCVVRIANVTAEVGKGCTDNLLVTAKELLPSGFSPTFWFMSRRSRAQLRTSRSAVTMAALQRTGDGVEVSAPVPTADVDGVPIIATDSIPNTDAIEA
ncbi:major capsid protein [Prosthecobacter dejongeii]|uniref:Uncharacterized protein n=1 Tax=Prosthecobacter dejongeii TaxID=48465 RepID=A0A7W7YL66_9BACT|nr:hypothetical protein [Prosthecobacter dejongeii]MBB5038258.1 hypothetical protein [Prosthecobacter dejongeii]